MSLIRVTLDYDSNLWLEDHHYRSRNEYNGVVVDITPIGITLSIDIEIKKEDKIGIANGLQNKAAPHWQDIPVSQHQILIEISRRIYDATNRVDMALRSISKCYRLPTPKFSKFHLNQQQYCDVMTWILDDEDRADLTEVLSKPQEHTKVVNNKSVALPFPINYDRKQIHLNSIEVKKFELLVSDSKVIPYKQMFAEAYSRFTARQHDAAILLLATSLETALKAHISEKGGALPQYMLDKMASPSLENLLFASSEYCGLKVPSTFKNWISELRVKRNDIAHKPISTDVSSLEIGRWIGVVEAVIAAIDSELIDESIGQIISPIGKNSSKVFSKSTFGVILRVEPYLSMPPYHVLMATGETYRMNKSSFQIVTKYKFNS